MTDEELLKKIITNIKRAHKGEVLPTIYAILKSRWDLSVGAIFLWRYTPEGDKFWEDIYCTRLRNHLDLRKLLLNFLMELDAPFITIEFFI